MPEKMDLDVKQMVLFAVYTEYQKDLPNMGELNAEELGIDDARFVVALDKLENEGHITGLRMYGGIGGDYTITLTGLKMTRDGIEYVENKLSIDKTLGGKEKVGKFGEIALKWGWEELKDFAAKVLAEMARK